MPSAPGAFSARLTVGAGSSSFWLSGSGAWVARFTGASVLGSGFFSGSTFAAFLTGASGFFSSGFAGSWGARATPASPARPAPHACPPPATVRATDSASCSAGESGRTTLTPPLR
jgi:hypothetical protein